MTIASKTIDKLDKKHLLNLKCYTKSEVFLYIKGTNSDEICKFACRLIIIADISDGISDYEPIKQKKCRTQPSEQKEKLCGWKSIKPL